MMPNLETVQEKVGEVRRSGKVFTFPETNSKFAPEKGWLEDEFPFRMAYFQGVCC